MEHQYSNSYIHVHIFILICSNSPTTCYNPWNLWRWQSWVKIMDCSHFPSGPNWHNGTHMCHTSLVDHKSSMSVKMLEALPFSMAAFFFFANDATLKQSQEFRKIPELYSDHVMIHDTSMLFALAQTGKLPMKVLHWGNKNKRLETHWNMHMRGRGCSANYAQMPQRNMNMK